MPCATVQPEPAIFHPAFGFFQTLKRFKNNIKADSMRSMRIGKVTSRINLVWFHFLKQIHSLLYIVFIRHIFADLSPVIKGKILEMDMVIVKPYKTRTCYGLPFSD